MKSITPSSLGTRFSIGNAGSRWRSDSLAALKREARACVAAMPMVLLVRAILDGSRPA